MFSSFNKVKLDREGKVTPTVISSHPFFEEWSQLTIEDVVHHTTFLRTYVVTKPFYFLSNLLLTEQFLINNMDDDLYCKCLETYQYQPPSARGGPLLFITMLKELVENKQDIARSLFIQLQSLKLSDFERVRTPSNACRQSVSSSSAFMLWNLRIRLMLREF
jgi:hypothetical protein